jgi:hypothetical protein
MSGATVMARLPEGSVSLYSWSTVTAVPPAVAW